MGHKRQFHAPLVTLGFAFCIIQGENVDIFFREETFVQGKIGQNLETASVRHCAWR